MAHGPRANLAVAAALGAAASRRRADEFARNVLPVIREAQGRGVRTYAAIAAELNQRAVRTAHGRSWHASSVWNLLRREHAA
jgi:hypothetical protein